MNRLPFRAALAALFGDIEVAMVNPRGDVETVRMHDLLPRPFDDSFLR